MTALQTTPASYMVSTEFGLAGVGKATLGFVAVKDGGSVDSTPLMSSGDGEQRAARLVPAGLPGVVAVATTYQATSALKFGAIGVDKQSPSVDDVVLALIDTKSSAAPVDWKFVAARRLEDTAPTRTRAYALAVGASGLLLGGDASDKVTVGPGCGLVGGSGSDGFVARLDASLACLGARSVATTVGSGAYLPMTTT